MCYVNLLTAGILMNLTLQVRVLSEFIKVLHFSFSLFQYFVHNYHLHIELANVIGENLGSRLILIILNCKHCE